MHSVVHPENVYWLIVPILPDITIDLSLVQSLKAAMPTRVIFSGNTIVSNVQSIKATKEDDDVQPLTIENNIGAYTINDDN